MQEVWRQSACMLSHSVVFTFATPWPVACQAPLSMEFSRQEYWNGLPFPFPGDLPNPGIEPGLLHCRWILYQLNHKESPRILEWVAYPFPRRSSLPRSWTRVSCIVGGFFTSWAMNGEILKAFLLRLRMKIRLIIITDSIHHLRSPS